MIDAIRSLHFRCLSTRRAHEVHRLRPEGSPSPLFLLRFRSRGVIAICVEAQRRYRHYALRELVAPPKAQWLPQRTYEGSCHESGSHSSRAATQSRPDARYSASLDQPIVITAGRTATSTTTILQVRAALIGQRPSSEAGVELTARSAICVQVPRDGAGPPVVLHEKDADRPVTPASITKLVTAVTALKIADERGIPTSAELTVSSNDNAEGSGRNVREGDRFTFRDAMANLLLASSNVSANVMARTFGTILLKEEGESSVAPTGRFLGEMNAVAGDLQMATSRFLNPHGLAIKGQRSTARDLSLLVRECLDHPLITEFWGLEKRAISIDGPNARKLAINSIFRTSTRKAVPDFAIPQFKGGKSGTLWPSMFNLAAVSETVAGDLIISVTIGSPSLVDRYSDYLTMVEIGSAAPSLTGLRPTFD